MVTVADISQSIAERNSKAPTENGSVQADASRAQGVGDWQLSQGRVNPAVYRSKDGSGAWAAEQFARRFLPDGGAEPRPLPVQFQRDPDAKEAFVFRDSPGKPARVIQFKNGRVLNFQQLRALFQKALENSQNVLVDLGFAFSNDPRSKDISADIAGLTKQVLEAMPDDPQNRKLAERTVINLASALTAAALGPTSDDFAQRAGTALLEMVKNLRPGDASQFTKLLATDRGQLSPHMMYDLLKAMIDAKETLAPELWQSAKDAFLAGGAPHPLQRDRATGEFVPLGPAEQSHIDAVTSTAVAHALFPDDEPKREAVSQTLYTLARNRPELFATQVKRGEVLNRLRENPDTRPERF